MICLLAWSWTHASELSLKFQALKSDALVGEVVELEVSLVNTGTVAVSGVFLLEETTFEVAVPVFTKLTSNSTTSPTNASDFSA